MAIILDFNLLQIISALCLQSDYVKDALLELKFRKQLKEIIKSKSIDDNLLEYQIKGINNNYWRLLAEFKEELFKENDECVFYYFNEQYNCD